MSDSSHDAHQPTHEDLHDDMEDPLAAPTWVVGIVGGVIFVACVLGVAGLLYDLLDARQQTVVLDATRGRPVDRLNEAQLARLDEPARRELRIDSPDASGSIVIPIEDAMRIVIEEAN